VFAATYFKHEVPINPQQISHVRVPLGRVLLVGLPVKMSYSSYPSTILKYCKNSHLALKWLRDPCTCMHTTMFQMEVLYSILLSCWSAQGSIYTTLMWLYVLECIAYTVQHVAYIGSEACTVYVLECIAYTVQHVAYIGSEACTVYVQHS